MIQLPGVQAISEICRTLLTPSEIFDTVEETPVITFFEKGYRSILLDVDNTLMTYEETEVSLERLKWIETLKEMGFSIYLVSNNISKRRILRVAKQLEVRGIYFACKPFTFGTKDLLETYNINPKKSIIIGDQLLKDVLLGNWLGMHSILVNPIDIRKSFFKTLQRDIELWLLQKISRI